MITRIRAYTRSSSGVTPARRLSPLAICLVGLALGTLAVFLVYYFQRGFIPGDATVYLAAGERLNAGHGLYALVPGDRDPGLKPPYWTVPLLSPPLIGVVFRPLAMLPWAVGAYIFWAATLASIAMVLAWYFARRPLLASLAVLILVVPLTYEIGVGNMNPILLLLAVMTWRWAMHGREGWAGAATALGVVLKVSPLPIAWWLITQRKWSAVKAGLVAGIVIAGISVLGAGLAAHFKFIEVTRDTATIGPSDLSLAGIAKFVGVAPSIANALPIAMLLAGFVGIVLLRHRPDLAFALAIITMTLGSPVVNINSYSLLLGCLAPWMWPVASREGEAVEPSSPPLASTASQTA